MGPIFKSKKIIEKNLKIFFQKIFQMKKKKNYFKMWKNYGMTFIEYIFLNIFKKNNSHIEIFGEKKFKKYY